MPPEAAAPTGYAHPAYVEALSEFGRPLALPASGGWLLERPIGTTGLADAMGAYPLFCCTDWMALSEDWNTLRGRELVSAVLVADPFGRHDAPLLEKCFDRVAAFKMHFVIDLQQPGPYGTAHHRQCARRAFRDMAVEVASLDEAMLGEWATLYQHLIERHAIAGMRAFSRESFRRQFAVPGLLCFRAASRSGECVAAHLWFTQDEVAYSHLAAANGCGYRLGASYALYSAAIEFFRGKVSCLNLGGGAGSKDGSDGLTKFKAAWANTARTAYLCGKILNPQRYHELAAAAGARGAEYFPAYRYADAA
ncbi:MAG TPA: hypothetical protein VLY04_13140 [Bryobacteraceae bacterium]|nr:hypothetical protein [Bryobacteraceae bacterium]